MSWERLAITRKSGMSVTHINNTDDEPARSSSSTGAEAFGVDILHTLNCEDDADGEKDGQLEAVGSHCVLCACHAGVSIWGSPCSWSSSNAHKKMTVVRLRRCQHPPKSPSPTHICSQMANHSTPYSGVALLLCHLASPTHMPMKATNHAMKPRANVPIRSGDLKIAPGLMPLAILVEGSQVALDG